LFLVRLLLLVLLLLLLLLLVAVAVVVVSSSFRGRCLRAALRLAVSWAGTMVVVGVLPRHFRGRFGAMMVVVGDRRR